MTNLSGLSHFLVVSLSFGHETERRRYCAQHTANVAAPEHLHRTLLDANYRGAATLMALPETADGRRLVLFGYDMGAPEVRRRLRGRSLRRTPKPMYCHGAWAVVAAPEPILFREWDLAKV